jgi:hypothetical protein
MGVMNQGGNALSSSEILYPDPKTIPVPPSPYYQQPIPLVTLSDLIPGKYVSTTARVVYVRTIEKQDELGNCILHDICWSWSRYSI